jgi:hypothetical protein
MDKKIYLVAFNDSVSGRLRGIDVVNNPDLKKYNMEFISYNNQKNFKNINNSILIFIKGKLKDIPEIFKSFGENNTFVHDIIDAYSKKANIKCIENEIYFDKIIVNSKHMRRRLIKKKIPQEKIVVIYHPCDKNLKKTNVIDKKLNYIGCSLKTTLDLSLYNIKHIDYYFILPRSVQLMFLSEESKIFDYYTSTKLSTCIKLESVFICNKIPVFYELLGSEYPFYINDESEIISVFQEALKLLTNEKQYQEFYERFYKKLESKLINNRKCYRKLFDNLLLNN